MGNTSRKLSLTNTAESPNMESKKPGSGENNEKESVLSILKGFCGYASCGFLSRVIGSKYLVFRILWLLVFLAAFAIGIYHLVGLFFLYGSKPVSTRVSLQHSVSLSFPTITLCNYNIIRKSRLNDLPASIKTHIGKYATKRNASVNPASNHQKPLHDEDLGIANPDSLDEDFIIAEEIAALLAKEEESKLKPLGHQFYNMIRTCKYKGMNCRNNSAGMHWSTFWHYKFGNCYTFNPQIINGVVGKGLMSFRTGPSHGLIIEMDTEQNEYIDQLTQNAGAVVDIKPIGQMSFPFEHGINIAPGFSTSIGLTMVNISRINKKNSCVTKLTENNKNIFAEKFNSTYSKTACVQSCIAYNQKKHCGCMEYKYHPQDKLVCDIFNMKTVLCLRNVLSKATRNQLNCTTGCPSPCQEEIFKTTSSFSTWPSENYMESYSDKIKEANHTSDDLRKNLLKIQIYYQDLNYEYIREDISYLLQNFISDIGGQLGLFLGVSLFTAVQIIELIAVLVMHLCCKSDKEGKKNPRNGQANGHNGHDNFRMTESS